MTSPSRRAPRCRPRRRQHARERRQQHEHQDHHQVLDHQPADRDLAVHRVEQAARLERPQQHHGTRHRQREAEHQRRRRASSPTTAPVRAPERRGARRSARPRPAPRSGAPRAGPRSRSAGRRRTSAASRRPRRAGWRGRRRRRSPACTARSARPRPGSRRAPAGAAATAMKPRISDMPSATASVTMRGMWACIGAALGRSVAFSMPMRCRKFRRLRGHPRVTNARAPPWGATRCGASGRPAPRCQRPRREVSRRSRAPSSG